MLSVLARKIGTFEVALKEEFPDTAPPSIQEKVEAKRKECRDWLSAFAFVQLFRLPSGAPHVSKVLVWLGVEAVPLILLFVLDLSFVRYQSDLITWEHHIIFVIDLTFLAWFNWQVLTGRFWVRWIRGALAVGMALLLIFAAHPPSFDPETVGEDRKSIRGENEKFWKAVLWDGENPLDIVLCRWKLVCRYLDVSSKWLSNIQIQDISSPNPDDPGGRSFAAIDLARRKLRFANFQGARLQGANLTGAHLQGANLMNARLQGAHLGGAHLQDASLSIAHLQGANL